MIFQGDALTLLLFYLFLILLSIELNRTDYGYRTGNESISHLFYMDLKMFSKYEDNLEGLLQTVQGLSDDIETKFRIGKITKAHLKEKY